MARFFHPGKKIRDKWPNDEKRRLTGVLIIGEGKRHVNKKEHMCYLVRIPEIDDGSTFHIVKKNFKVDVSPPEVFESESVTRNNTRATAAATAPNLERATHRNAIPNVDGGRYMEDELGIEDLVRQGIQVDDDNQPAPENSNPQPAVAGAPPGTWEKPSFCPRRANSSFADHPGKWKNHRWDLIADYDELALFRLCFPEEWIVEVLIPTTNVELVEKLTLHEFYCWLGCIFYMACYNGIQDREMWWSTKPIDMFCGAPFRLNAFITYTRFRDIMAAIRYTNKDVPILFTDKFHEVRQMIDAFNNHYTNEYTPSWLNCIDESMSSWLNKFCPGFMCVPRKPHPQGNEYHSIADADKDGTKPVMWRVKIVEGKDRPKRADGTYAFASQFEKKGYPPTVSLLLEMTEPIHRTGKVVTGDSGFCVAQGVLALDNHGVYSQFLIKKRRYWPKGVPGDYIDEYMSSKPLGATESFVQEINGKRFYVHCTRDRDYVTKIMSTHGVLDEIQDHSTWRLVGGEWKTFKYAEPFSRHNRAKHWVDDVNNRRHDPIALEEIWATKWWPNRQFTFLLSVAEANAVQVRARARKENAEPSLDFRKQLAKCMLTNKIGDNGVVVPSPIVARLRRNTERDRKRKGVNEGKWNPSKRCFNTVKTEYLREKCTDCSQTTREYCSCNPGRPLCRGCFALHAEQHGH